MHNQTFLTPSLQMFRQAFPLLENNIYLANCSQAPLSSQVSSNIGNFLAEWATRGMSWTTWIEEVERAREYFATLIGTQAKNIAVGSSVSQLVSSVASALVASSKPERRVISSGVEFPGVAHAWLAMRKHGWSVDLLPADERGLVSAEAFASAIDPSVALVSMPHVCYGHGALIEPGPVVEQAHAHGAMVFVDAYQSLGTLPINVHEWDIDFLAAGTLKYLLATAGIAFLYVSPRVRERLEPTVTGWFGRSEPFAFQPGVLDYAASAARFDLGTPPLISAYAARAGLELILNVGVGDIYQQIQRLSMLAYELAPRLELRIIGPEQADATGATTAIDAGSVEQAHTLEETLRQQNVIVSARGSAIRLAPHGFTTLEDLEQALRLVADLQR